MDLLDLFVRITAKDETSEGVESASQNIIGKLAGAAKTAAKALAGMWAVKKVVDFGKAAFESYAQYEQLVGGVDKLFGDASDKLQQYAQQAYATAGMSANEYMQQATLFSAALINSLGGDTAKAADQADVAMRAISDNVNTFGSDIESVTGAFQGFAKGQYNMLDNLRLGYDGTKTEMERLIADAEEYASKMSSMSFEEFSDSMKEAGLSASELRQRYDRLTESTDLSIDSYSDVISAIEIIQEKQNIAGTTAREAMGTIEGSLNMTKAAWQNLVTEFGKPDADIGARVSDMIMAVFGQNGEGGLARNVVKEVRVIAGNMVNALRDGISYATDWLVTNGPSMLGDAMQSVGDALERAWTALLDFRTDFNLVDALFGEDGSSGVVGKVTDFLSNIGATIADNWPYIKDQILNLWDEAVATFETFLPQAYEAMGRLLVMVGTAIVENGPEIAAQVGDMLLNALSAVGKLVGFAITTGAKFFGGLVKGTSEEGKALRKWFADFFPDGLLKGLGDFATFLLDAGKALIDGLLDGIGDVAPQVEQAIRDAFQVVIDFFGGVAQFLSDPIGAIKSGLSALGGAFSGTEDSVEGSMSGVEGSVGKAMDSAKSDMASYNKVRLNNKKATATVSGNAVDGTGKTKVGDMVDQIGKLQSKTVYVKATGNAVDGTSKSNLEATKRAIDNLRDKTITVTTNRKNTGAPAGAGGSAWGGIAYHATGGIKVANRWGQGVPLDVEHRVGERGAEAIVPLTSRYGGDFARLMGQEAAKYMGGPSYHLHIGNIEYNTDEAMDKAIDNWFAVAARRAGQYGIA